MKKEIVIILVLILIAVGVYFLFFKTFSCVEYGNSPEITTEECIELGGEIINTLDSGNCCSEKNFLGTVIGVECQCVCCKK